MLRSCIAAARAGRAVTFARAPISNVGRGSPSVFLRSQFSSTSVAGSSTAVEHEAPATPATPAADGAGSLANAAVPATPVAEDTASSEASGSLSSVEAWTRARVHPAVVERLVKHFPDVKGPTPAQLSFLLTVMRGDVDVFMKDYMGRGKTFSLVLAALSMALQGNHQIVILLPTPHLVEQVEEYFAALAGPVSVCVVDPKRKTDWNASIIVSTSSNLLAAAGEVLLYKHLPNLTHVFVDEPDMQLGPLPSGRGDLARTKQLPINRHPPPLARALDSLLGMERLKRGQFEATHRTNTHTVWSSATLDLYLRRYAYGRGWTRGDGSRQNIVDLDHTATANDRQVTVRDSVLEIADRLGAVAVEPCQAKAQHFAFSVDKSGKLEPLESQRPRFAHEKGETLNANSLPKTPGVAPTLVEAVAFIEATSPPPPGTYSLVVVPDSASITSVQEELEALDMVVARMVPELLADGIPAPPPDSVPPILLSNRSAVPGLHLPNLHTLYLLNGLDVGSLSAAQRKQGGRRGRQIMYSVIAGRLGRFASASFEGQPQRIISLVPKGELEELMLKDMFHWARDDVDGVKLSEWKGEL